MSSYVGSSSDLSSDEGLADRSFSININMESSFFSDMVHDQIELHGLCKMIVNTPQFDRLRNLRQLGLCCFVFPTGTHSRFEHCLGTSYLAEKYGRILKENQPELGITEKDILCLSIAGLIHDLGHGPFSHTWEHFMKKYKPDYSHEVMSIRLFDFMVEENGLQEYFECAGLEQEDLKFIKECVLGHPLPGNSEFVGRSPDKWFLYQIVSNDEVKIDVDKFDYMLRDCMHLHVKTCFEYKRVMANSRVVSVPSDSNGSNRTTTKIAYRKKIADSLADLFFSRFRLHQVAYQHKKVKIVETMVLDGLHAANDSGFQVTGNDGKAYKLSTAYKDLNAFIKLTDSIFELILNWTENNFAAKEIFANIQKRNLYKYFGFLETPPKGEMLKDFEAIHPNIKLIPTKINYGNGSENPLNSAYFYDKSNDNVVTRKKFPDAKVEEKCYIVYQSAPPELSLASSVNMSTIKTALQDWSNKYEVEICLE